MYFKKKLRLILVVLLTSLFVFIQDVNTGLLAFAFSAMILFFNRPVAHPRLLLAILAITTLYMLVGNILFSPGQDSGYNIFIFQINPSGLNNGITGSLKRGAMILLSFAWLSSNKSLLDAYNTLKINKLDTYNKFLLIFFRHLLNQGTRLKSQLYGLKIRGVVTKSNNFRTNIIRSTYIIKSLFNRFFNDIGPLVYSGESHFPNSQTNSPQSPGVYLSNVTAKYEESQNNILSDINLSILEKSFVFLDGRNKAGKTSLMRVISGYIPNIIGEIYGSISVCGQEFNKDLEISNLSAFVRYLISDPDSYLIGLTVRQEILLHCNDEKSAYEALKTMGIDQLDNRLTTSLSGGEKVRLVLASLLASKSNVILLDSVMSQLDSDGRDDFIQALSTFYSKNNCIIIVSDYLPWHYYNLIDRYVLLESGRLTCDISDKKTISSLLPHDNGESLSFSGKPQTTDEKLIELMHVDVEIDHKTILKNFSLTIFKSELAIIVGKNGSGKTTAMQVLSGLTQPTNGKRIVFQDKLKIGFLFQNISLQIIGANVEDELLVGPHLNNWDNNKTTQFLNQKCSSLGLEPTTSTLSLHAIDLYFLSISAADIGTDLMIFDEPSSFMDIDDLKKFWRIVESIRSKGSAVIIVTHDERIIRSTDNVISMEKHNDSK